MAMQTKLGEWRWAEALRIAAAEAAALREMAIVEARELLHMELVAGRMTEEES